MDEWQRWASSGDPNHPPATSASPEFVYRFSAWRGWPHWLGTDDRGAEAALPLAAGHGCMPFATCHALAQSLRLQHPHA